MIGNGPSGIALSFFLSGHWPYYTGVTTDPFLHARLEEQQQNTSLVQQDLLFLADGLEGRSNNPVALLFDALQRPEADLGMEMPSLLEWRFDKDNSTDHVVLGRGQPGGVWQTIEGDMLTVSLGGWMELPNLSMAEWKASSANKERRDSSRRATVAQVSQYYLDYIDIMGIGDNFVNNTLVTGVKRLTCRDMVCPKTKYKKSSSPATETQPPSPPDTKIQRQFSCPENVAILSSSSDSCPANSSSSDSCPAKPQHVKAKPRARLPTMLFDLDDDEKDDIDDITSNCSSLTQSFYSGGLDELRSSPSECRSSSSPITSPESPPISGRYYPDNCDIFDECSGRDASVDMFMGSEVYDDSCLCPTWDPILNPSLFSSSFINLGSSLPKDSMRRSESFQPSSFRRCNSISNSYNKPSISNSYRKSLCPVQDCSEDEILYEVTGVTFSETDKVGTPFKYLSKNIVLATGMTDEPNELGVPGENLGFVLHSLHHLEEAVRNKLITPNSDPVLVVGAGLSAADAIINIQGHNIPVVHAFRRSVDDRTLIFNKLPVAIYPEYHAVHKMMAAGVTGTSRMVHGQPVDAEYAGYRAFPETTLAEITQNRRVRLTGPNTNQMIQVSYVVVLIGASPDLSFLEESGENLGRLSGPIDRNNPIDIDVFTHESIKVPGLYAMGPLTGDNFVRFLQGGALAITSDMYHKKRMKNDKIDS